MTGATCGQLAFATLDSGHRDRKHPKLKPSRAATLTQQEIPKRGDQKQNVIQKPLQYFLCLPSRWLLPSDIQGHATAIFSKSWPKGFFKVQRVCERRLPERCERFRFRLEFFFSNFVPFVCARPFRTHVQEGGEEDFAQGAKTSSGH